MLSTNTLDTDNSFWKGKQSISGCYLPTQFVEANRGKWVTAEVGNNHTSCHYFDNTTIYKPNETHYGKLYIKTLGWNMEYLFIQKLSFLDSAIRNKYTLYPHDMSSRKMVSLDLCLRYDNDNDNW